MLGDGSDDDEGEDGTCQTSVWWERSASFNPNASIM